MISPSDGTITHLSHYLFILESRIRRIRWRLLLILLVPCSLHIIRRRIIAQSTRLGGILLIPRRLPSPYRTIAKIIALFIIILCVHFHYDIISTGLNFWILSLILRVHIYAFGIIIIVIGIGSPIRVSGTHIYSV